MHWLEHFKIRWWIVYGLILFGLCSITGLAPSSIAFGTKIAEVIVILVCACTMAKVSGAGFAVAIFSIAYVLLSGLYALLYMGGHPLDFFIIYKSYIYLALLSVVSEKILFSEQSYSRFFSFLLFLFFIKYSLSGGVFLGKRPALFIENNFELMFLAMLAYKSFLLRGRFSVYELFLLVAVFLLSGSRSGVIMFAFMCSAMLMRGRGAKGVFLVSFFILLFGPLVFYLFVYRSGGDIESIDRYVFMMLFLNELEARSLVDIFLGAARITPMQESTCVALSSYKVLFSYASPNVCYSNVLHSFVFRAILDHGFVGFGSLLFAYFLIFQRACGRAFDSLVFLGIPLLNSLSVSGFNSSYYVLSVMIVISVKPKEPQQALFKYKCLRVGNKK